MRWFSYSLAIFIFSFAFYSHAIAQENATNAKRLIPYTTENSYAKGIAPQHDDKIANELNRLQAEKINLVNREVELETTISAKSTCNCQCYHPLKSR